MLYLVIPPIEKYDSLHNLFFWTKEVRLTLEHSLVSIAKWESKWRKPFFKSDSKTKSELLDYIRCMTITQNVDPKVYNDLTEKDLNAIIEYISEPMTAKTFQQKEGEGKKRRTLTSEDFYYLMISYGIPFDCEKWHFNRLVALIKTCEKKNQPKRKRSKAELYARNSKLNAARRAAANSKG